MFSRKGFHRLMPEMRGERTFGQGGKQKLTSMANEELRGATSTPVTLFEIYIFFQTDSWLVLNVSITKYMAMQRKYSENNPAYRRPLNLSWCVDNGTNTILMTAHKLYMEQNSALDHNRTQAPKNPLLPI